jgi:hypothetical protein
MACVTSVRYSVHFNGTALSPFRPSRGLRQGDPFLPYLFLLVAECLSVLMRTYGRQGLISGIWVSRRDPSVTHLLFADDSLLFFKLGDDQARSVRDLLHIFEKGSGQKLNPAKCSLLVKEGVNSEVVNQVKTILNVDRADFDAKYLGLPMPEGRMRRGVFKSIEEQNAKRMLSWNERTMSCSSNQLCKLYPST